MNKTIQLTLDFDNKPNHNDKIQEEISNIQKFNFNNLFTNMTKLKEIHNNHSIAILGDSIEILQNMKSNSVNLIFIDAPYNIGKNFGNNKDKWNTIHEYVDWCKHWIMALCIL